MTDLIKGKLSPEEAIPKAYECATGIWPKFGPGGHLYTTYRVATLAGMDNQDALVLAYFSQYPDIDPEFDAVKQFPYFFTEKRDFIMRKLHSLHGGNLSEIQSRKDQLCKSIKQFLQRGEFWKAGILIHSLGDAYSHTKGKLNSSDEKSYRPLVGHGLDTALELIFGLSKDPDNLNRQIVREKYIAYVNNLFILLKNSEANEEDFAKFIGDIKIDECIGKMCPTIQLIESTLEDLVDKYIICMNSRLKSLNEDDVENLFSKIDDI